MSEHLFFSIIIPAHNEELYIDATLHHVKNLRYPAHRFEAIVIENRSADKTLEKARAFEGGNLTVVSSPKKGVSSAKNIGIEKRSPQSEWTVFLDADTVLKESFLADLNDFLQKNAHRNHSFGTTEIQPVPDRPLARAWFAFYDLGHRLTKTSYSIQIVKNEAVPSFRFDEETSMGEEHELISQALQKGRFFFFPTKHVLTSTRRFDNEGWLKVFFSWTFVALLPASWKRKFSYKVVR